MKNEDVFFQIAPAAGVGDGELEISAGPYDGRIPREGSFDVSGQSASDGAQVIQTGTEEFVAFDDDIYPVLKSGGVVTLTGRTNAALLTFDIRGLDWTPALPATYTADGQTVQNGQAIPKDPGSTRVFPFSIDVAVGANPRVCLRGCRVKVATGSGREAAGMILQSAADLPKAFPPCGPAGGDLSGEYPNPTVERAKQAANADTVDGKHAADFIPATDKGSAGGVAELDEAGKVPAGQLPSFVDDVLEYANLAALPNPGEGGKIYVTTDTNLTYRWSGTGYVEISKSLGLGETSGTAYPGNKGKQNADDIATLKTGKLDKTGDASNTTVAFTQAADRTNITTGEKLSSLFGKIARWFSDLKAVAFSGSYNDLTDKPAIPTVPGSLPPTGPAGGDLSGEYPNPTVERAKQAAGDGNGLSIAGNYLRKTYTGMGNLSQAGWYRIYTSGVGTAYGENIYLNLINNYWNTAPQMLSLLISVSTGYAPSVLQLFSNNAAVPFSKIRVLRKGDSDVFYIDAYYAVNVANTVNAVQFGGTGTLHANPQVGAEIPEGYTATEYAIKAGRRMAESDGTYPDMSVGKATNDGNGLSIAYNYLLRSYVRPGGTWSGAKWRRIYIAGNTDNPGGTVMLNIATLYWNTPSQLLSLLISAGPRDVVIQQFNGCYNYPISKIRVCRKSDAPWCVDVYCSDTRNNSIFANQCGGDGYIVGSEMADPSIEGYTVTEYEIKAGDRVANKSEVDALTFNNIQDAKQKNVPAHTVTRRTIVCNAITDVGYTSRMAVGLVREGIGFGEGLVSICLDDAGTKWLDFKLGLDGNIYLPNNKRVAASDECVPKKGDSRIDGVLTVKNIVIE